VNCRDARELSYRRIDGELDAARSAELERHLGTCAACAEEAVRLRRMTDALEEIASHETTSAALAGDARASDELERHVVAIRDAIDAREAALLRRPPPWRRRVAAACVLALGVGAYAAWRAFDSGSADPNDGHDPVLVRDDVPVAREGDPIARSSAASDLEGRATLRDTDPPARDPSTTTERDERFRPEPVATAVHDERARLSPETSTSATTPTATVQTASTKPEAATSVAAVTASAGVLGEPIDERRLADVRAAVEMSLVHAEPTLAAGRVEEFVEDVDERLERWRRDGWPVVRLVERSVGRSDPSISVAAMRWLGRRGDAIAARRVAVQLDVPETRSEAVNALLDMGPVGRDLLIPVLHDSASRERVLGAVASVDPAAASSMLERAVRGSTRGLGASIALTEVERRGLADAVPWIEALANERATSDPLFVDSVAMTLASLDGVPALRALLRMRASARFDGARIEPALAALFLRTGDSATAFATEIASPRRAGDSRANDEARALEDLRQLAEAMQDTPTPNLVPAWLQLARIPSLGRADRRIAILLVGELGDPAHVEPLGQVFQRCGRRERDLKAAALIAIHALGGDTAADKVLASAPSRTRQRAMSILSNGQLSRAPQTTLLELARELEPQLAPLQL